MKQGKRDDGYLRQQLLVNLEHLEIESGHIPIHRKLGRIRLMLHCSITAGIGQRHILQWQGNQMPEMPTPE